jgi:glycosyltransferase involved in cell wall biosynthesis
MSTLKVSVIMPVERLGGDAERAIRSILGQEAPFPFELIVVSAAPLEWPAETRLRNVVEPNRNPATRRNRAASAAMGELLAFIDDDAVADPRWLANAAAFLDSHADVLALGGPDPAPPDSTVAELISDTLLATPWIGSGVAAHENRRGTFDVKHPSDVALVNLIVRSSAFSGFDESVGYIGEDTALLEELMQRGRVVYSDSVRVFHRRRAFPGPYLRQRWRYRMKTGEMMVRGSRAHRGNPKIRAFLIAGVAGVVTLPVSLPLYLLATFILGARHTRLPIVYWPLIPFAFAAHHTTYFAGIVWGMLRRTPGQAGR